MENVIIFLILVIMIGLSVSYIIKAKKRGVKCIGCPAAGECGKKRGKTSGNGGCGGI